MRANVSLLTISPIDSKEFSVAIDYRRVETPARFRAMFAIAVAPIAPVPADGTLAWKCARGL
jgi:hypothetical protein